MFFLLIFIPVSNGYLKHVFNTCLKRPEILNWNQYTNLFAKFYWILSFEAIKGEVSVNTELSREVLLLSVPTDDLEC